MELTLVRVTAEGGKTPVGISRDRTLIGRDTACQIRVPAVDVSRQHCEVLLTDDGVTVADLGSRNGTLVNGSRVERAEVSAGDVLTVGPLIFVVQIDGEPGEIDPADAVKRGTGGGPSENRPKTAAAGKRAAPEQPTSLGGGLMDGIGPGGDLEDSSVVDFDFDFDDSDEDEQPPL